jgi:hypothetical protein
MKKILLIGAVVLIVSSGKSQVNMYGQIEDAYRTFMLNSHSQFNRAMLNDFMGVGGDTRFMSNYWMNGGATNNFDVTISTNYLFNYDFLGHELHAKWKDTAIVVNTNYVKRFFLSDNIVTRNFVKSPPIDPQGKYFFESIGFNEEKGDSGKVQLLKLRTIKQVKANKNDYLANFSGDYSDKFDNDITYYIVLPDNSFTKVKMTKKSLSAALSNYKEKVDNFFKGNSEVNEQNAGALIRYINK